MKREDVVQMISEELDACGVGVSHRCIRKVPSQVSATAIVGGSSVTMTVMSGLPRDEVVRKIREFQNKVCNMKGQADIEQAARST